MKILFPVQQECHADIGRPTQPGYYPVGLEKISGRHDQKWHPEPQRHGGETGGIAVVHQAPVPFRVAVSRIPVGQPGSEQPSDAQSDKPQGGDDAAGGVKPDINSGNRADDRTGHVYFADAPVQGRVGIPPFRVELNPPNEQAYPSKRDVAVKAGLPDLVGQQCGAFRAQQGGAHIGNKVQGRVEADQDAQGGQEYPGGFLEGAGGRGRHADAAVLYGLLYADIPAVLIKVSQNYDELSFHPPYNLSA